MAPHTLARRRGHDWGSPNLDAVGITYMVAAVVYSIAVFTGLFLLWQRRSSPAVRMRGFGLTTVVVLVLHFYAVFVLVVYPINGLFKCGIEFWVMSIVLPFGVALFQASNIRLLSYYEGQRNLASLSLAPRRRFRMSLFRPSSLARWSELSFLEKTYVGITAGLIVQVAITAILFFGSRRFHQSYGFFSEHVDAQSCRHGYEWIPSIFWQLIWSCVLGPYILLRTRNIKDTRYWARQTRLAIIAALPGSPLWLLFLYAKGDGFRAINRWFVPAGWFLPGLMTMQAVSIIFPLLDAYRSAQMSDQSSVASSVETSWSESTTVTKDSYSMASLELQLERNIGPLLKWTAETDFTAENILFLKAVRDLRARWNTLARQTDHPDQAKHEDLYRDAAMIFFTLVNPLTARFNINISYRTYSDLANWFSGIDYEPVGRTSARSSLSDNVVSPWLDISTPTPSPTTDYLKFDHSITGTVPSTSGSEHTYPLRAPPGFTIPKGFSPAIFDRAHDTVKQDVFRNTWTRYEAIFGKPCFGPEFNMDGSRSSEDRILSASWTSVRRAASKSIHAFR